MQKQEHFHPGEDLNNVNGRAKLGAQITESVDTRSMDMGAHLCNQMENGLDL